MDAPLQKILLVEDEPDIRTVADLSLRMVGGFTVEACGSAQEALERLETWTPDLVLLDVMMPGMDGPALLERLQAKEATADLAVVFMTARIQPHEVLEYRAMGALDVVGKPFDPMELPGRLRAIWNRAEAPGQGAP